MVDTLSVNNEYQLVQLASSMGQDEHSWGEWKVLFVSLNDCDDDTCQDCLIWVKSIVRSYLKDIEGQIYFCEDHGIHIMCKDTCLDILDEAGRQICDLINNENDIEIAYCVYDLERETSDYAHGVLNRVGNIFRLHKHVKAKQTVENSFESIELKQNKLGNKAVYCKPKVLLVEDDPVTRWMVRNVLKDDCEFVTAPSANKVFSVYATYQPDIVFLDIGLPDHDGHSVLQWIMHNDPGACVIMFSSNNSLDNVSDALENGAKGFISKPFLRDDLLAYIDLHTGQSLIQY